LKAGGSVIDYSVIKEIIRESLDAVVLLEHYGITISDRSYRYNKVRCCCPLHSGDNPSAFSFDLNTKQFTCFTTHCGEGAGNSRDVFQFIQMMEEKNKAEQGVRNFTCSFSHALKIASELTGITIDATSLVYNKEAIDRLDNKKWTRTMAKINNKIELDIFEESEVEMFKAMLPMCDYINTRRFDDYILDFFEIGYSPDGVDEPYKMKARDFYGRIIFPVRSSDGQLVGWSGRLCSDDEVLAKKFSKYRHKLDFDKGFCLYNFHNAKEFIKESKEIILVEGPWDVMRLWSYGVYNAVAIMGSSLTPEQLSLAISSAFKVKVFLDSDGAGKSGAKRICDQLKKYVDVYIVSASNGKDPDNLELEEAWNAILSAKKYVD
jgi:DNA primase